MPNFIKTLLSIVFWVNLSFSFAQSTADLDVKYGFKGIRLDEPLSKYPTVYTGTEDLYRYTGTNYKDVFTFPIEQLLFTSKNGIIDAILIIMPVGQGDRVSPNKLSYLNPYFVNLFGKETSMDSDDNSGDVEYQWRGRKVMLTIQYKYRGYKDGWQAFIAIEKMSQFSNGF